MDEIRGSHGACYEDYFLKEYDAIKSCRQTPMLRSTYKAALLCVIFKDRNVHNINWVRKVAITDSLSSTTHNIHNKYHPDHFYGQGRTVHVAELGSHQGTKVRRDAIFERWCQITTRYYIIGSQKQWLGRQADQITRDMFSHETDRKCI